MLNRLKNTSDIIFLPSLHGCMQRNNKVKLDEEEINKVKKSAFEEGIMLNFAGKKLLDKVFSSGVCSGLSACSLLTFAGIIQKVDEDDFYPLLFQARTLSSSFIKKSINAYFTSRKYILEEIVTRIKSSDFLEWPLLMFLPKVKNINRIEYSHTVVPYSVEILWTKTIIKVYDSNFPKDDNKVLIYDKLKNNWLYEGYSSKNWVIAVNILENLYKKGYFLLR